MKRFFISILLCTVCIHPADQLNQKLQKQLNSLLKTDQTIVSAKHLQCIIQLVHRGANPNLASKHGNIRILHLISGIGNTHMVKWLLDHNANPQLTDARGWNAFTYTQFINNPSKKKAVIDLLYTSPVAPVKRQALT